MKAKSMKQAFARSLAFVALTIAVTAPIPGTANAQAQIRLGHNRVWSNPALIVPLATGAFEKAGIKVVERQFNNPADVITAIASGDLDAGVVAPTNAFTAVEKGVKIKAVALLQGRNNPPIAYLVRADSGINTVADLRGKKIGINNYGGNYDIFLRYWLTKNHLDPKKNVSIILVPIPAALPSLINRQSDAVALAAFARGMADQQYPGQTKVVFSYDDVLKDGTGAADHNSMMLVASDSYIARSRGTLVKFLEEYLRSVRAMNKDPKEAVADWAKVMNSKAILNLPAPPTVRNDGELYMKSLQFEADQALRFGYLDKPIQVNSFVDEGPIKEAAAKLK